MTEMEKISKGNVVKASGAVQIASDNISLIGRRCYNVLLHNAYSKLSAEAEHTIKISDLLFALNCRDLETLDECLRLMRTSDVEFNLLQSRDKSRWEKEGTTLLASTRRDGSYLVYAYSPVMRERLANPQYYAKINLAIQRKFTSKYALALYELCCDYYIWAAESGQTPYIELDDLRKLLGCENDKTYQVYKYFKSNVLNRAMAEVNASAPFDVTLDRPKRQRQTIIALRFLITAKAPEAALRAAITKPQGDIPLAPGGAMHTRLVAEYGLTPAQATKACKQYDEQYIKDTLIYVTSRVTAGKVDDLAAFTWAALAGAYAANKQPAPQPPPLPEVMPGMWIDVGGELYQVDADTLFLFEAGGHVKATKVQVKQRLASGLYKIASPPEGD